MKTANVTWTKSDMVRVIVQALFNSDTPAKADNIHVKRMVANYTKPRLEEQLDRALKVLEQREMQA